MRIRLTDEFITEVQNDLKSWGKDFLDTLNPRALRTCEKVAQYVKGDTHFNWLDRLVILVLPTMKNRYDKKLGALNAKRWAIKLCDALLYISTLINKAWGKVFKVEPDLTASIIVAKALNIPTAPKLQTTEAQKKTEVEKEPETTEPEAPKADTSELENEAEAPKADNSEVEKEDPAPEAEVSKKDIQDIVDNSDEVDSSANIKDEEVQPQTPKDVDSQEEVESPHLDANPTLQDPVEALAEAVQEPLNAS